MIMRIIKGMDNLPSEYRGQVYLALGNFDGVHMGHQEVIKTAVRVAKDNNGISAVLIFDPHPAKVINPGSKFSLLSDMDMKAEIFESLGLNCLIIEPFNKKIASLSPEEFLNICLRDKINVKGVITGFDYSFGKFAAGDTKSLKEWGRMSGFEVIVCSPVKAGERIISSSAIRKMVSEGKVEEASHFLNYYFYRRGEVVPGEGRGKKLGFPTANIQVDANLILPGEGVYFTVVKIGDQLLFGATNVGKCPTFSPRGVTMEVNIVDYSGDLYGKKITLYFIRRIRDEIAFSTSADLVQQLSADIELSRKMAERPLKYPVPGLIKTGRP